MDVEGRFRRSLNHRPQPVPFISELFGAEVRVESGDTSGVEALTLQPLPFLRVSADFAGVEVEGRKARLISHDDISRLCLRSYLHHEFRHIRQVYSDEGSKIYEEFERFINATKEGREFEFRTGYKKLEVDPTLYQYTVLTFPEIHELWYNHYGDEHYLVLARAVEKYGEKLGLAFRRAVERDDNHRVALDYERYLPYFGGGAFIKYSRLLSCTYINTFSKDDFIKTLRLMLNSPDYNNLHPKDAGIDLDSVKGRLNRLKNLGGSTEERAEFLLNNLPRAGTLDDFDDKLGQFANLMPAIIYCESEDEKGTYVINYKSRNRIWLGYHIDLSIAFQIRRAKLIKNRDDPRRQVRCPFSQSKQFKNCGKCLGLLYPEEDFIKCKFLKEWERSEGLKALYG